MINTGKIKHRNRAFWKRSVLLLVVMILSITTGMAQEEKISFSRQNLSRREAVNEIKNQTGFHFAINHTFFDDNGAVYFNNLTMPLREALNQLLAGTNQTYQIRNGQILILAVGDTAKEEPPAVKKAAPDNYYPRQTAPVRNYSKTTDPDFERQVREFSSRKTVPRVQEPQRDPRNQESYKRESVTKKTRTSSYTGGIYKIPPRQLPLIHTDKQIGNYSTYLMRAPARFSVKINALYGLAALTPNLGVEVGLTRNLSLEMVVGWNPFNKEGTEEKNKKLNHFLIKPELRYWLCERSNGHFFGVHPFFVDYNVSERKVPLLFDKEYRYEGNGYGIGISYGYHWMLSRHWGIEFNIGVGAAFLDYSKFPSAKCSDKLGDFKKKYFGPTSAGIKLVYILK